MTDSPQPSPEAMEAAAVALPCLRTRLGHSGCDKPRPAWESQPAVTCFHCDARFVVALAIDRFAAARVAEARAQERERCAQVAESVFVLHRDERRVRMALAAAIRALPGE